MVELGMVDRGVCGGLGHGVFPVARRRRWYIRLGSFAAWWHDLNFGVSTDFQTHTALAEPLRI